MDIKDDISTLRNFKNKYHLKEMVVHFYSKNMDNPEWIYVAAAIEKLIPGVVLSYMIFDDSNEMGMFPVLCDDRLYLIEMDCDGKEILEEVVYCKKRINEIEKKLSSSFGDRAPKNIVENERNRLSYFNRRWEAASIGFCFT